MIAEGLLRERGIFKLVLWWIEFLSESYYCIRLEQIQKRGRNIVLVDGEPGRSGVGVPGVKV